MAYYLIQAAYTTDAVSTLVKNPQDRAETAARPLIESLGGKLVGMWMAFGEYDLVGITELPDNVSAVALSMAVSAGGAIKTFKTTPLITVAESVEAMRKAGGAKYQPPKS